MGKCGPRASVGLRYRTNLVFAPPVRQLVFAMPLLDTSEL